MTGPAEADAADDDAAETVAVEDDAAEADAAEDDATETVAVDDDAAEADAMETVAVESEAVETGACCTAATETGPLEARLIETQRSGEMAAARAWLAAASVAWGVMGLYPEYSYAAMLMAADGLAPGPGDPASDACWPRRRAAPPGGSGRPPEELPEVGAWRDAYRAFGARPQRTGRASRPCCGGWTPGFCASTASPTPTPPCRSPTRVPVGGEDRAACCGPARLVRARGEEAFDTTANGSPAVEHPDPGEVVWRDEAASPAAGRTGGLDGFRGAGHAQQGQRGPERMMPP